MYFNGCGRFGHQSASMWCSKVLSVCVLMSASAQPDVMATRELGPSVGLHPARMFEASLRLCTTDMFECYNRVYSLPVQPVWASACDTLGDVQHTFDQGVPVGKLWYWVSAGDQNGAGVELTLYSEQYCGGNPVEFNTSYQGRFSATQDPEKGDRGWLLQRSVNVMSVRATAVGTYTRGARQLGVKLVVFPRCDMDHDLHTVDEFTCVGDGYRDVGLGGDHHHKWPSDCASPIDRVYCLDPTPSGSNWGAVDDWPTYGFDFADNWNVTKPFKGTFPMGSAFSVRYTSSWTGHAPCTDPSRFGSLLGNCLSMTPLFVSCASCVPARSGRNRFVLFAETCIAHMCVGRNA